MSVIRRKEWPTSNGGRHVEWVVPFHLVARGIEAVYEHDFDPNEDDEEQVIEGWLTANGYEQDDLIVRREEGWAFRKETAAVGFLAAFRSSPTGA